MLIIAVAIPASTQASEWEPILDEQGIRVWQRELPDSSFVEFRARGEIASAIIHVAAVLRNSGRGQEWMENCVDSHVVEWKSAIDAVIYNRTQSPTFIFSDRDLVADARTTVIPETKTIIINFKSTSHPRAPEVSGVVRYPNVRGHWSLTRTGLDKTEVEYQLVADPGGAIPAWIVNWAVKSIPFSTIVKLREQVKKDGYDIDEQILEAAIDFSAFENSVVITSVPPPMP